MSKEGGPEVRGYGSEDRESSSPNTERAPINLPGYKRSFQTSFIKMI